MKKLKGLHLTNQRKTKMKKGSAGDISTLIGIQITLIRIENRVPLFRI